LKVNKYAWRSMAWVGLIYSTLYIVRPICNWLKTTIPFSQTMAVIFVVLVVLLLIKGLMTKGLSWQRKLLFSLIMGAYILLLQSVEYPEEKVHLLEYGVLAYLLYKAFEWCRVPFQHILAVVLIGALVGYGDEVIQYFLPNRYFEWSDVFLNAKSVVLGLIVTITLFGNTHEQTISK
jgi:hypothetical protein